MDIKIIVENKVQRFYSEESRKNFIEGNLNSSFLVYDLEPDWKECDIINCHFIFNGKTPIINKLDLETNRVVIPDSLQGLVSFGLIGYVGGEKRLTTNLITVKIYSSALDAESDTSMPPDIFEQYLEELLEVKEQSINSAKESKRYAVGLEEEPETLTDNSKYYYEGSKENANKTNEDRIQVENLKEETIKSVNELSDEIKKEIQEEGDKKIQDSKSDIDEYVKQKENELKGETGDVYFASFLIVPPKLYMYNDTSKTHINFEREGSKLYYQWIFPERNGE